MNHNPHYKLLMPSEHKYKIMGWKEKQGAYRIRRLDDATQRIPVRPDRLVPISGSQVCSIEVGSNEKEASNQALKEENAE